MGSRTKIFGQVRLKPGEKKQLKAMTTKGEHSARVLNRARILLLLDKGKGPQEISEVVDCVTATVNRVGKRYLTQGLDEALFEDQRPGPTPLLSERENQQIIAMVCGPPPEGRASWSTQLIAEEAIKRKICRRVGRETIRILLLSHDLKPWREKNVVRGGDRR
jgi:putative transposase